MMYSDFDKFWLSLALMSAQFSSLNHGAAIWRVSPEFQNSASLTSLQRFSSFFSPLFHSQSWEGSDAAEHVRVLLVPVLWVNDKGAYLPSEAANSDYLQDHQLLLILQKFFLRALFWCQQGCFNGLNCLNIEGRGLSEPWPPFTLQTLTTFVNEENLDSLPLSNSF